MNQEVPGGDTVVKKSICWFCKGRCGVDIQLMGDRLVEVALDKDYPVDWGSHGLGCRGKRYKAAVEWFYHPSRLNYPLKRKGRRGENSWEQIPWDQALDEIAEKLSEIKERFGAEYLVNCKGDDWSHSEYETRFLNLYGSPNIIGPSPICWGPRCIVSEAIFGWHPMYTVKPNTKCILMLGVNIEVGRPAAVYGTRQAVKNGARMITLDPQRSSIAEKSDVWLQLKPGTDAAVLLGMINHIISENLYDRDYVDKWCYGFEELRERVRTYTLDRVERISGVPADLIAKAAQMYATNRPGVIYEGMGVEQQTNSAEILHARCILAGICGNVGVEGGEDLEGPHPAYVSDREIELLDMLPETQKRKQIGYHRFKLHSWPGQDLMNSVIGKVHGERGGAHWYLGQANLPSVFRAIISGEPYQPRAMIVSAANPMVSHPDTRMVYKALKKLELLVVMDVVWTPTAQLADYVLPATSWLERPIIYSEEGFGKVMEVTEPVVPPRTDEYDRRNDFDLWRGLGIRLGQQEYWPWETAQESFQDRLKPRSMSWEEVVEKRHIEDISAESIFNRHEKIGFGTPSGKVELYSLVFEKLGYDPLPKYIPHPESEEVNPDLARDYPLLMINGSRIHQYMLSTWRQVDSVRRTYPDPLVKIHPETAIIYGIAEGDWVWIESRKGRIRQKCVYFDGLLPGVVHCDQQWWYPEMPGGEPSLYGVWQSNVCVLLEADPDHCNEIIGSWPHRMARVKVYK